LYMMLAVPSVVMAAAIGVIEVVVPGDGPCRKIIVSIVSALNTCLLTISNMYGFQSVKDQHFQAAKLYSTLLNEFDYTIWFPAQQDPNSIQDTMKAYLAKVEKKTSELASQMPPIPIFILEQVRIANGTRSVVDPSINRLDRFLDSLPALGAASLGVWQLTRPSVEPTAQYHAGALFVYAFQTAVWLEALNNQEETDEAGESGCRSICGAAMMKFFGSHGIVAIAMLTWSISRLMNDDLTQLLFILPQGFALLSSLQHRSRRQYGDSRVMKMHDDGSTSAPPSAPTASLLLPAHGAESDAGHPASELRLSRYRTYLPCPAAGPTDHPVDNTSVNA